MRRINKICIWKGINMKKTKYISIILVLSMLLSMLVSVPAAAATETLANGDMSEGSADKGAALWRNVVSADKGGEGAFLWQRNGGVDDSACLVADIKSDGDKINAFQMQQNISGLDVAIGDKYVLSFDAKIQGADSYVIKQLWIRDSKVNYKITDAKSVEVKGDKWAKYTVELEALQDHQEGILTIQFGNNGVQNAKLYLDNISLLSPKDISSTPAPKPTSTHEPTAKPAEKVDLPDKPYVVPDPPKSPFDDCNEHWARTEIEIMRLQGIVNGKTINLFEPESNITRAEFLALIVRAVGVNIGAFKDAYADITADKWYAATVQAGKNAGLINAGMIENNNFNPEKAITREEMTSMIAAGYKIISGKDAEKSAIDQFTDKGSISAWAAEDVQKAFGLGIIKGITETTFEPKLNATRAQAAVMISRLLDCKDMILRTGFDTDADGWTMTYRTADAKPPRANAIGTVKHCAEDGNTQKGCMLFDMEYTGRNQINTIQGTFNIQGENGQNVIEKDKHYLITFYAKIEGVDAFPINVIKLRDLDNNNINHSTEAPFVGITKGGWKKYYAMVTATETLPLTKLIFQAGGCEQRNVKFYLDDICVYEVSLNNNVIGTVASGMEQYGTVIGSGAYPKYSTAELNAVTYADSGYMFDTWLDSYSNAVEPSSLHKYQVYADATFTATYKPYTITQNEYAYTGTGTKLNIENDSLTESGTTATITSKLYMPEGYTVLEAGALFYNECYLENFNIFSDKAQKLLAQTISADGMISVSKDNIKADEDVLARTYAIVKDTNGYMYIQYGEKKLIHRRSGEIKPYKLVTNYEMMSGYTDYQITEYIDTDVEMITITPSLYRTNMWRSEVDTQWKDYVHGESGEVGGPLEKRVEQIMADLKSGRDLFGEKVELARKHNFDVFVNYRMNDLHRTNIPTSQTHNRFYWQNPQYWINNNGDVQANKTLNYMEKEVRDYYYAIVEELVTNYDVDGLELDLQRSNFYFENDEIVRGTPIMTEFIMRVRAMLDRVGKQKGKYLPLSVRIGKSVDIALSFGLDAKTWDEMKLIDMFNVTEHYFNTTEIDVESFINLSDNSRVHAELQYVVADGGFGRQFCQPELLWATAANFYARGVDGITMFNMNYSGDRPGTYAAFKKMSGPEELKETEKLYTVISGYNALPKRGDFSYDYLIADDVESGIFKDSIFRIQISNPTDNCNIDVYINGTKLEEMPTPEGETELFPRLKNNIGNTFYPKANVLKYYKVPVSILKNGTNSFRINTLDTPSDIQVSQTQLALYH